MSFTRTFTVALKKKGLNVMKNLTKDAAGNSQDHPSNWDSGHASYFKYRIKWNSSSIDTQWKPDRQKAEQRRKYNKEEKTINVLFNSAYFPDKKKE